MNRAMSTIIAILGVAALAGCSGTMNVGTEDAGIVAGSSGGTAGTTTFGSEVTTSSGSSSGNGSTMGGMTTSGSTGSYTTTSSSISGGTGSTTGASGTTTATNLTGGSGTGAGTGTTTGTGTTGAATTTGGTTAADNTGGDTTGGGTTTPSLEPPFSPYDAGPRSEPTIDYDAGCTALLPINSAQFGCVQCVQNSDCATGQVCEQADCNYQYRCAPGNHRRCLPSDFSWDPRIGHSELPATPDLRLEPAPRHRLRLHGKLDRRSSTEAGKSRNVPARAGCPGGRESGSGDEGTPQAPRRLPLEAPGALGRSHQAQRHPAHDDGAPGGPRRGLRLASN